MVSYCIHLSKIQELSMVNQDIDLTSFMRGLARRNDGEVEFQQAVLEVAESIIPFINAHREYRDAHILERLTEPDRIIIFRVCWEDDKGNIRTNRGYRVQFNNSIGPYKGGLRFHPSVNLSILKFLGFEQVFKNSLTSLPIGGAKGGSNFNPKGKSDREVMRFCQSFMGELSRHIGPHRDIPAGDIGVGSCEIGYLFGQYKRIHNEFTGMITGKGLEYGGSLIRTEATGYGCVYFSQEMLATKGEGFAGKVCIVSGSGNVAQYTVEKLIELGAKVVSISDSTGFIYDAEGFDSEKLNHIKDIKNNKREKISYYLNKYPKAQFKAGEKPWGVPCYAAFPCATQNEITEKDAKKLVKNSCKLVAEGANMPTTYDGTKVFHKNKILYAPGKAANAGGVAISGLEITQNMMRLQWSRDEVDMKLREIMSTIHRTCVDYGQEKDWINYSKGANIGGFVKVADTMLGFGAV